MAAVWANYKIFEFFGLSAEKQSFIVASYRSKLRMDAVAEHESIKKAKKRNKKTNA